MVYFNDIHRWNAMLCPPTGFLLNFLLIWLIFSKTSKEMQKHSRILLQTCVLDILLLAIQTIGQPLGTQINNTTIVFFKGILFEILGHKNVFFLFLHVLVQFWSSINVSVVCGGCVQFIYRYLLLNRDYQMRLYQYLALLLFPFAVAFSAFRMPSNPDDWALDGPIPTEYYEYFDSNDQPFCITYHAHLLLIEERDVFTIAWFFASILLVIVPYPIIIFCGWKMARFVNAHLGFSARLKELNKQLTKTLIILAICPLCFQAFSLIQLLRVLLMTQATSFGQMFALQFYGDLFYHWLPVINPIVTIYVNRPYRDAILRKFKIGSAPE